MAKKVKAVVKIQCDGIAIMDFCNQYNEQTRSLMGQVIPAVITIYEDRTFDFILKQAPASELIKKAIGLDKGSGVPNKQKVGKITRAQLRTIAEQKMPDLNALDIDAAMKILAGTAKQMGVEIE